MSYADNEKQHIVTGKSVWNKKRETVKETTFLVGKYGTKQTEYALADSKETPKGLIVDGVSKLELTVMVLASLLAHMLAMGFSYSLGVLYTEFVRVYESSRTLAALVQSLYLSIAIAGGGLWNTPVQKYGVGKCAVVGSLITAAGLAVNSAFSNVWIAIVFIGVVSGFGASIINIGPFLILNKMKWTGKSNCMPIISIGASLGQFITTVLAEELLQRYGLTGAQLIFSGLLLNLLPIALIMHCFEKRVSRNILNLRENSESNSLFSKKLCKMWRFQLMIINAVLMCIAVFVEPKFIVDLMVLKNYSRELGSLFASYIGLANLGGRIVGACLKFFIPGHSILIIALGSAVNGASHALVLYMGSYGGLLGAALLSGFSYGSIVSRFSVMFYEIFDISLFPPAIVGYNIVGGIGGIVGGYAGGLINDETGSYDLIFLIATVCSFVNAASFLILVVSKMSCLASSQNRYERIPI
ncbi:monocarboxylate transporter 4-like [Mya arenaria]|uniref:monocarboxylate transporter 4-like n=1 Tax=Mya arenaria TaxID=6604 RepID=UPI0022E7B9A9|nr:monocarboxylate transporter 4-like [Mya arenaria]